MKYLMVLNDGETFTDLNGCVIVEVPDDFEDDTIDIRSHKIVAGFEEEEACPPRINMAAPPTNSGRAGFPIGPVYDHDNNYTAVLYGFSS